MTDEKWLPVESCPGYMISSLGRLMKPDGSIQAGSLNAQGYRQFRLPPCKVIHAHKEVCRAFHGPKPFPSAQVRHGAKGKGDNSAGNVQWGTHEDNMRDRDEHGTTARGERAGLSKFTWEQVREMRAMRDTGKTRTQIKARFGIAHSTLASILANKTWVE